MYESSRVHKKYSFGDLVEYKAIVDVLEYALSDGIVQIGFHELEH